MNTDSENKNPDFKVPKGYFGSLGEQLNDQIELEKVLGGKIDSGFNVPNDYFNTLSGKISNLPSLADKKPKVIALHRRKWLWTAISTAAVAVLLIALNWNSGNQNTIESLELASIEEYLLLDPTFINDQDFETLLSEEDLVMLNEESSLTDEYIIDYLEYNDDSYNMLIE